MKKGLLATTALAGAGAAIAGVALAAEAPEWKLSGSMNFQFYYVDQDAGGVTGVTSLDTWNTLPGPSFTGSWQNVSGDNGPGVQVFDLRAPGAQEHGWYFGVDEAELALKVDGVADNGLKYGFKIEIQVNTDDGPKGVADEARIQLAGGWGTLQLGDEDGAEDIMNYGGENLMGATGGFDGDIGDVLYRGGGGVTKMAQEFCTDDCSGGVTTLFSITTTGETLNLAAPGGPSIAGDTSDATKISYYSPRFSGFQVGASITPTPNGGDGFKEDGAWENHIGLGANYDNTFGSLRVRASAVYSARTNVAQAEDAPPGIDAFADVSAWSVGGIVGWGPFSIGGSYTDNGDSAQPTVWDDISNARVTAPIETYYWDVAARYEAGPMAFAVGYFMGVKEFGGPFGDSTYEHIALTADYKAAPGLAFYAEIDLISEELIGNEIFQAEFLGVEYDPMADGGLSLTNDATVFIMGVKVSF